MRPRQSFWISRCVINGVGLLVHHLSRLSHKLCHCMFKSSPLFYRLGGVSLLCRSWHRHQGKMICIQKHAWKANCAKSIFFVLRLLSCKNVNKKQKYIVVTFCRPSHPHVSHKLCRFSLKRFGAFLFDVLQPTKKQSRSFFLPLPQQQRNTCFRAGIKTKTKVFSIYIFLSSFLFHFFAWRSVSSCAIRLLFSLCYTLLST